MIQTVENEAFRVLVAGYINLNVIDGSAFFISGLASMLSELPSVEVDILTANPVKKLDVLDEVMYRPNVNIIDPYSPKTAELFRGAKSGDSMAREEYAELISQIGTRYDAIVLRDSESASHLVKYSPQLGDRLFAYVTGIHTVGQDIDLKLKRQLRAIFASGARFVCQTEYIQHALMEVVPEIRMQDVYILTPHVPDGVDDFDQVFVKKIRFNRFVYTGKFFEDWNTDRILASFKDLNHQGNSLFLDVAGDQFRHSKANPNFVKNNRWLLDTTPGVTWHGRVPRAESRKLIEASDIGIGWRSESLNGSSELSTKILEYGILGRPSILNRTPLHERLLGSDYPLFANSMTEFKELLASLPDSPETVRLAAKRCFDLAKHYSYSHVRPGLLSFLGNLAEDSEHRTSLRIDRLDSLSTDQANGKHPVTLRGQWAVIHLDAHDNRTVHEQLTEIQECLRILNVVERTLRERKDIFFQSIGALTESETQMRVSPNDESRVITTGQSSSEASQQKIKRLESKVCEVQRAKQDTQDRLTALRNSKLGKLQLEIWRQRNGSTANILPAASRLEGISRKLIKKAVSLAREASWK